MMKKIITIALILTFSLNQLAGVGYARGHGDTLRPEASAKSRSDEISGRLGGPSLRAFGSIGKPSFSFVLSPEDEHDARMELNRLRADYGFLAQDHPVAAYLRKIIKEKIYPDMQDELLPRIEVLASKGCGVNSMVYPNNTIVVTPELLEFVQYEEELIFVLCHEIIHMDREHFSKSKDVKEIRKLFGLLRYQEMEADIRAFYMLEERNVNPQGAISVLQKFKAGGADWGPVHGSSGDRLLNIESLTYLKDTAGLSYFLTKLPEAFSRGVDEVVKIKGKRIENITRASENTGDYEKRRIGSARKADIYLIPETITGLKEDVIKYAKQLKLMGIDKSDTRTTAGVRYNESRALLDMLTRRAGDLLRRIIGDNKPALNYTLLVLGFGVPFLEEDTDRLNVPIFRSIKNEFLVRIEKDFQAVLEEIREYLFKGDVAGKLDIEIRSGEDLRSFVRYIFGAAAQMQVYDTTTGNFDFERYLLDAHSVVKDAQEYAGTKGLKECNAQRLWTEIVFEGIFMLYDLGQNRSVARYLEKVISYKDSFNIDYQYLGILIRSRGDDIVKEKSILRLSRKTGFGYDIYKSQIRSKPAKKLAYLLIGIEEDRRLSRQDLRDMPVSEYKERMRKTMEKEPYPHLYKYKLDDFAEALGEIRKLGREKTSGILTYLHSYFTYMIERGELGKIMPEEDKKERVISIIHFLRIFEDSEKTYAEDLNLFLQIYYFSSDAGKNTFTLAELEDISNEGNNLALAEERFGQRADLPEIGFKIEDIMGFKAMIFEELHRVLMKEEKEDSFFDMLDNSLNRWPIISQDEVVELFSETSDTYDFLSRRDEIIEKGVKYIGSDKFKESKLDSKDLKRLFMVSFFLRDVFIRTTVQEYILLQILKDLSFDEALFFAEEAYLPQKRMGFMRGWEYLIEEKADTAEEMDMLTEKVLKVFKLEKTDMMKEMGNAVGVDYIMENMFKKQDEFLSILLDTAQDDRELKEYLFSIWYYVYKPAIDASETRGMNIEELKEWASVHPHERMAEVTETRDLWYLPLENILNLFYRMDYKARYVLLRKLLMSEKGVLTTDRGRRRLLSKFMDNYVRFKKGESGIEKVVRDVLGEFIMAAQDDKLYFALYPMLIERVANPPQKATKWQDISEFKEIINNTFPMLQRGYSTYLTLEDDAVINMYGYIGRKAQEEKEREILESKQKEVDLIEESRSLLTKNILMWICGYDPDAVSEREQIDELLLSVVPEEVRRKDAAALGSMKLILEIAQRLGTPGILFLQLLGQFMDIPEKYEREFMDACDSMVGQSRLSGYQTLKRECPDYVKRIRRFGRRIGGGSLRTVYQDELTDGSEEALRIINPNAEYFSRQSLELIRKVLTGLSDKDKRYSQALSLLDGLQEWIEAKLHDDTFLEDDKVFKEQNHGYNPKGFSRKIYVPRSKDSGSPLILREEFIKGRNLTTFKPADKCSDDELSEQQEIVALLARNYFDQIFMGGFSSKLKAAAMLASKKISYVHSDIHPGNFRVMGGNRVAILDREAFIKLNREDRKLFYKISQSSSTRERLELFIDYLSDKPGNEGLKQKKGVIISEVMSVLGDDSTDLEDIVADIIIKLRMRGIKIPLKISLLIKNLNGLNRLAQRVGFSSLGDALEFKPKNGPVKKRIINSMGEAFNDSMKMLRAIDSQA
ncbi:MAG: M48 family metalloprotease [Candidatus Omnitrophota bacterium]